MKIKPLKMVHKNDWPSNPRGLIQVHKSRDFFVQIYDDEHCLYRITVNRVKRRGDAWRDNITWDELQAIKNYLGFGVYAAVELYPPKADEVTACNMRHLWVLKGCPNFMWTKIKGNKADLVVIDE